jgi:hypothetical protein
MTHDPRATPANARTPDSDRAGAEASARLPEWVVHLIALVIHFMLRRVFARSRRSGLPSWQHDRLDLPAGSAEALAASVRGSFGNSIAWRCLRHGIGPGHPDWPELSRAIVAFGGSIKGFRAGAPARGLLWWENPGVIPGMVAAPAATPAAAAMAVLLARQAQAAAPTPAPTIIACCAATVRSAAEPALPPVFLRQVLARTATGPPTGPPVFLRQVVARTATGPPTAPPGFLRQVLARTATGPPTDHPLSGRTNSLMTARTGPEHGWPRRTDSRRARSPVGRAWHGAPIDPAGPHNVWRRQIQPHHADEGRHPRLDCAAR